MYLFSESFRYSSGHLPSPLSRHHFLASYSHNFAPILSITATFIWQFVGIPVNVVLHDLIEHFDHVILHIIIIPCQITIGPTHFDIQLFEKFQANLDFGV